MNDEIILSIIINSYNEEKYLGQCISSVLKQLNNNIELIIVDDDSKDKSIEIINSKLNKTQNITLYSILHKGISNARNFGISKAKGNYIMFIDGDDYIIDNSLNDIINYLKTNNVDVTIFNIIKYNEEKNFFEKEKFTIENPKSLNEADLIKNKICARPWRFIYKKDMLIKNNILFPKNLVYEDEEWVPKIIYYAKCIRFLDKYVYVYRKRKGSITTTKNIEYIINLEKIIERVYDWSLECINKKKYIYFSLSRCIRNILTSIDDFSNLEEKKIIINWLKDNREMISDILNYNRKLKYSISIFGYKKGVKIYKKIFKEKYLIEKEKILKIK